MKDNFGNNKCKEIVENQCPYCNEHLLMNKRTFANHVRWCKCNPKYKQIRLSTITKVSNSLKNKFIEKHGQIKEFKVYCKKCGKEILVYEHEKDFPKRENYYCSISCANSHQHSDETKNKIRNALKKDKILYKKLVNIVEKNLQHIKNYKNVVAQVAQVIINIKLQMHVNYINDYADLILH